MEPHLVFRLDAASGAAVPAAETSARVLREALGAGDVWLHGGSAAVAVRRAGQEERIALCHSKEPDSERWRAARSRTGATGEQGWLRPRAAAGRDAAPARPAGRVMGSDCGARWWAARSYATFAYAFEAAPPFRVTAWARALQLRGRIQMALALAPLAAPRGARAVPADVLEPGGGALVSPRVRPRHRQQGTARG